jgi:hypothetical protein
MLSLPCWATPGLYADGRPWRCHTTVSDRSRPPLPRIVRAAARHGSRAQANWARPATRAESTTTTRRRLALADVWPYFATPARRKVVGAVSDEQRSKPPKGYVSASGPHRHDSTLLAMLASHTTRCSTAADRSTGCARFRRCIDSWLNLHRSTCYSSSIPISTEVTSRIRCPYREKHR